MKTIELLMQAVDQFEKDISEAKGEARKEGHEDGYRAARASTEKGLRELEAYRLIMRDDPITRTWGSKTIESNIKENHRIARDLKLLMHGQPPIGSVDVETMKLVVRAHKIAEKILAIDLDLTTPADPVQKGG